MSLKIDVVDSLLLLKCPVFDESEIENEILDEVKFSVIVSWLSTQLQPLLKLETNVHSIEKLDDFPLFIREFEEFIRELKPPFPLLTSSFNDWMNVLNYLCGELFAARLGSKKRNRVMMNESVTAKNLKSIVMSLKLGKPPDNITTSALFTKVVDLVKELLQARKLIIEDPAILKKGMYLKLQQWEALKNLELLLAKDYAIRRETLLTRCDCTVSSFKWKYSSDKEMQNRIDEVYNSIRRNMNSLSPITTAHALAARESDCVNLLNSVVSTTHEACVISAPSMKAQANSGEQQRLSLHKFVIGYVPDRGGRPTEQPPPPTETFDQQQKARENQQQRGGHNNRGGSRGGSSGTHHTNVNRVQGSGWNNSSGGDQRMYNVQYAQYGMNSNNSQIYDQQWQNQRQYEMNLNENNYQAGYGGNRGRGGSRRGHRY